MHISHIHVLVCYKGSLSKNSIIKIGQNTKKSVEDMTKLAVSQTPMKKTSAYSVVKNSQKSEIIIMVSRALSKTNSVNV